MTVVEGWRPLEHLQDPRLVQLKTLRLELEPLFEIGDLLELLVLFVQEVAEFLLVTACLAQIPLVSAPGVAVPDAPPQEPQRHPREAEEEHCDDEYYHRAHSFPEDPDM